jgi:O-antigen/teichoic acid export membrane protein
MCKFRAVHFRNMNKSRLMYLSGRAIASFGALFLAFLYSSQLGVSNRSLITFVMTSNALILLVLTSGTTLTLRKLKPGRESGLLINSFLKLISIEMTFGLLLYTILLATYLIPRNSVPTNLLLASFMYFVCSGLHLVSMELLIAFDNFRLSGIMELVTIAIQITTYLLLTFFSIFSDAVGLLLSLSLSYIVVFFTTLLHFLHLGFLPGEKWRTIDFWRSARGSHTLGGFLAFMDRSDRLFIAYLFPTLFLGKYAVMSTMLSMFRFLPDSLSKFTISKRAKTSNSYNLNVKILLIILIPVVLFIIFLSQKLIGSLLGEEWLLPWYVSAFFIVQEILRGSFQIFGNLFITSQRKVDIKWFIFKVSVLGCLSVFLFTFLFGISGVSIAFSTTFALLIFMLRREAANFKPISYSRHSDIQ